jgi:hypothetical protein
MTDVSTAPATAASDIKIMKIMVVKNIAENLDRQAFILNEM